MSLAIGIIIGLVVGALGVFAAFSRRTGAQQASIEASQAEVERMRAEGEGLRTAQQAAQAEAAAYRATAESLQVSREEDKVQFEERISTATNEVIAQGSRRLTELATERFKTEVDPIKELLERYETQVRDLEKKRELAYSSMDEHLKRLTDSEDRLRKETANLVTALRTPQTRGAWGESQLRRVVEFAGMLQHCDFVEQFSSNTDEGLASSLTRRFPSMPTFASSKLRMRQLVGAKVENMRANSGIMLMHLPRRTTQRCWAPLTPTLLCASSQGRL
jgi:DNA recombination protein RmuC